MSAHLNLGYLLKTVLSFEKGLVKFIRLRKANLIESKNFRP